MGAYLSEPITEKVSKDEQSSHLSYGASSMQGWRVSQEDAHNCIIDFDDNTSYFAVYDGHGGAEVASYCSANLPDCLRSTADYKKGNIAQALENAFLEFDNSLTKPEVIAELKKIAGLPESDDESVEDASMLREEASLPLDEVLARYETSAVKKVAPHVGNDYEKPKSPMLRGKKSASADQNGLPGTAKSDQGKDVKETAASELKPVNGEVDEKTESPDSPLEDKEKAGSKGKSTTEVTAEAEKPEESAPKKSKESSSKQEVGCSKNELIEPGCSNEGRSKTKKKKRDSYTVNRKSSSDEDDSEEDDDEEYSAEQDSSSADDVAGSEDDEEEDDDGGGEDNDEDSEEEDDESEDTEDEEEMCGGMTRTNSEEEPGEESGCTAVVALLRGEQLYVANAGDSRCVVSRSGKAINMSFDHKPEDKLESERIEKAGGNVTMDGRVNGGLNLSRAIGDHAYKSNADLSAKEQMITAFPDIQTLVIDPEEDQFMVLACDGIWNHMSSQEVVDFVNERIGKAKKLSSICEELFDHCLAPNTFGDGTGCDNMTAIIVKFHDLKKQSAKRQSDAKDCAEDQEKTDSKKMKLESTE